MHPQPPRDETFSMSWKRDLDRTLERRRLFFGRQMPDGILATLPVRLDTEAAWLGFERKWGVHKESESREFPENEEIFDRQVIGLEQRGRVDDDCLPVIYSILDGGESMVGGMFGQEMRFIHRPREAAFSKTEAVLTDYSRLGDVRFSLDAPWTRKFLDIQDYFATRAAGRFAQHPCLTMDTLNFAVEIRQAVNAYLDIYEHPGELRELMEIALDFNIRFQEAQMARTNDCSEGSFVWLGGWTPTRRAISLSVDAHVICSVAHYGEFGFEYNSRLIEHFGGGVMHFHCNRSDLAAEVGRLKGLILFQFGGDTRDGVASVDRVDEMRRAVGEVPIMVRCELGEFRRRLDERELRGNVWYGVTADELLTEDQANRLAEKVRAYRAPARAWR